MKNIITLAIFVLVLNEVEFLNSEKHVTKLRNIKKHIIEYYVDQPLDHFRNSSTWKMRILKRNDFWKLGGPVYIQIGGESGIILNQLSQSTILDLVRETNGVLFLTEHRYYGKSVPKQTYKQNQYKYLSSRQALADVAHFIKRLKRISKYSNSKVVAVGGSYAGNLASWLRQLYPDLVDAAWASSAPVLAKVNFFEYLETTGEVFRKSGGDKCYRAIEKYFQYRTSMFKSEDGMKILKQHDGLCAEVDLSNPTQRYKYFQFHIMPTFLIQNADQDKVTDICMSLTNSTHDETSGKTVIEKSNLSKDESDLECFDANKISYPWFYQMCTEFGYMITTSSLKQPFGNTFPLRSRIFHICNVFGKQFNMNYLKRIVNKTNKLYGSLTPNVTKVVYVNGGRDPWHKLGIIKSLSSDAPAIFMENTTHCQDTHASKTTDSYELKETRKKIREIIKKWILINN